MSNEIEAFAGNATFAAVEKLSEGRSSVFSTVKGNDHDSRMTVFNATTNSEPISENLGKVIDLVNIVVQVIDIADEETGEMATVPRTILIDRSGKSYHAISNGVFKSVENLLGVLGMPDTWTKPVTIKAVQGGTGTRKYFNLVAVTK